MIEIEICKLCWQAPITTELMAYHTCAAGDKCGCISLDIETWNRLMRPVVYPKPHFEIGYYADGWDDCIDEMKRLNQ